MPKLQKETVNLPSPGRWNWNDETQALEFTCFSKSVEIKEKRKKKKTSTYQEHFRKHLETISQYKTSTRGGCSTLKKTSGLAKLNAYKATMKQSQRDLVTIEDIKQVAVTLVQENEGLPIPSSFLNVIQSRELDDFLASLLLYLSCHLEKKAVEERPMALMTEQSVTERRAIAEMSAKLEMAKKHLGFCYSTLVLGLGLPRQHHMSCGRRKVSSTYQDRHLYECLYSFFCYVAWVTFGRRDLKGIQAEIGHLLRSDTFNPALRTQEEEPEEEQEEKEGQSGTKGPRQAVPDRKSQRWPALSSAMTQRSPVMVSLLPTPREKAPHLFQTSFSQRQQRTKHGDDEVLMEELREQLASFSFGILGKPLSQFSSTTLVSHVAKSEGEDGDDEDNGSDDSGCESEGQAAHVRGSRPSITAQRSTRAGKQSSLSRANAMASRATTEALSSDTE